MVFFKYKSIFVGIPKTATSSLFETWKNEQDKWHNHNTITQDYEEHGYEKIKDFYTFTIIRNPYDRFVSMAYQYFRDDNGDPTKDCNAVASYIIGKNVKDLADTNECFQPQYHFVCDTNDHLLVKNLWLYEQLGMTYRLFAADYNQKKENNGVIMPSNMCYENVSNKRLGKKWEDEINDDTIRIINDVYYNDFEIFKFKKIIV